jgi:hypothetical protein
MVQSAEAVEPDGLALSLFMPWIFTNHTDDILSLYNSAALTEPLNRRSHFHPNPFSRDKKTHPKETPSWERFSSTTLLLPEGYSAFRQIVRRHLYHNFVSWQDPNEM